MISTDDLTFFHVVATAPSLAEAARRLDVTPPAVTQRLRALEGRVGVKLIERTSRGLSLTDEGELVASEGATIIAAVDDLSERLASRTSQVRGHLRVAAPYGFGRRYIAPIVQEFASKHPAVSVTLELFESPIRQMSESWDIVVHIGSLPESDRPVTTLAPNQRVLCASPGYLRHSLPILKPGELVLHRCLALRENNEDVTLWRFAHSKHGNTTVRVKPSMSSNDGEIVRDWALAGLGVMVRSEWDVADDLAAGRLQAILPYWSSPQADVVALLHARHGRSSRTNKFLQALRDSLNPPPWRQ
ncbi:LysR family transcriptional regulator [Mesorhizobium erdmanii]|uniref:LysR family transcriptional regulator n=1 Tax=Mesorhizobium erdmanii TaxID=1777866 RepID=A0A6M7UNE9_9HYPH|nr:MULTISPECIES: LysR family transcriptional regulator [Mesorhizobium]OBQ74210.1 LysR family transcriptional regulator [Mesorhizobium loti]QKC78791.1 LysR family transcriptional regulator [Mesorhizobium erdmanii]